MFDKRLLFLIVAAAAILVACTTVEKRQRTSYSADIQTDAEIAEYGWQLYMDDKYFFPPYDLTPYVHEEVLDTYPEIIGILSELVATFPGGGGPATPEIVAAGQKVWQQLNDKVDSDNIKPDEVARAYLIKHDLIKD